MHPHPSENREPPVAAVQSTRAALRNHAPITQMMRPLFTAVLVLPLLLAGCGGWQSALDPQGPQATDLARLIWGFTWLLSAI
jgi:hypothetical protein